MGTTKKDLLATLSEFQQQGFLCDTTVLSNEDTQIQAHALVLAAVSPGFKENLCSSSSAQELTGHYVIQTVMNASDLISFISCAYGESFPVSNINKENIAFGSTEAIYTTKPEKDSINADCIDEMEMKLIGDAQEANVFKEDVTIQAEKSTTETEQNKDMCQRIRCTRNNEHEGMKEVQKSTKADKTLVEVDEIVSISEYKPHNHAILHEDNSVIQEVISQKDGVTNEERVILIYYEQNENSTVDANMLGDPVSQCLTFHNDDSEGTTQVVQYEMPINYTATDDVTTSLGIIETHDIMQNVQCVSPFKDTDYQESEHDTTQVIHYQICTDSDSSLKQNKLLRIVPSLETQEDVGQQTDMQCEPSLHGVIDGNQGCCTISHVNLENKQEQNLIPDSPVNMVKKPVDINQEPVPHYKTMQRANNVENIATSCFNVGDKSKQSLIPKSPVEKTVNVKKKPENDVQYGSNQTANGADIENVLTGCINVDDKSKQSLVSELPADRILGVKEELTDEQQIRSIFQKRFTCAQCGKMFVRGQELKVHERTHTGEKPFMCQWCGKHFLQLAHLRSHERCHTGEKPFKCELCGKTFSQSSSLNSHMRTHTGLKPFSCQICNKRFAIKCTFLRHQEENHRREKLFTCSVCGKAFGGISAMKRHEKRHCLNNWKTAMT